jgi:3-isopropylmalate/(R)-2-methylmalate dehydratase small subunit
LHALVASDSGLTLEVDLIACWVKVKNGKLFRFNIDEVVRQDFINGMDEVSATLMHADEIRQFEATHIAVRRWI